VLNTIHPKVDAALFSAAREVKEKIYGKRVVLFAPLYISNICVNHCQYCNFRAPHRKLPRKRLGADELEEQVRALLRQGHKRLLLVAGDDPSPGFIDYLVETIGRVYAVHENGNLIRRVNINCAPMEIEDFRRLKAAGIGTWQVFQETYHRQTYRKLHPRGPKADFDRRLAAPDLAFRAGIDDVGIGVLFGLYDHRFEVLALLAHAAGLESRHRAGPHTVSVPRFRPARGAALHAAPHPLSDLEFMRVVALLRLALPYTGLILSTREDASLRDRLLDLGISQISAGSSVEVGGYAGADHRGDRQESRGQFEIFDHRTLDQVVASLLKRGYLPSFCTACYRAGRTGQRFMELARPGDIQKFCLPNAMITFKEYMLDHASAAVKGAGEQALAEMAVGIDDPEMKQRLEAALTRVKAGEREIRI